MTISASEATVPVKNTDRFFIGGEWVAPSSDSKINVIDSHSEQVFLTVAEAQAPDIDRAVTAAKEAFDHGPWPRLSHAERAAYLRALGDEVVKRSDAITHGGFKQSGIGREGGIDGLLPFLESKAMLLDGPTTRYSDAEF